MPRTVTDANLGKNIRIKKQQKPKLKSSHIGKTALDHWYVFDTKQFVGFVRGFNQGGSVTTFWDDFIPKVKHNYNLPPR